MSLLDDAIAIARASGTMLKQKFMQGVSYEVKRDNSFVSSADVESHTLIKRKIQSKYPDHLVLSEEDDQVSAIDKILSRVNTKGSAEDVYLWVVDPLDGTSNFVHGLSYFNVSIACAHLVEAPACFEALVGVIYNPVLDELYYAKRHHGAYKCVAKAKHPLLPLATCDSLREAFVVCGYHGDEHSGEYIRNYQDLLMEVESTRRLGAAALDISKTAEGIFQLFFDPKVKVWDVMAARLLIQEVGGVCLAFPGASKFSHNDIRQEGIICGAPSIVDIACGYFSRAANSTTCAANSTNSAKKQNE